MLQDETTLDETTYCEVHPDRETGLRCNRCNRLMCAQCAVQTPVGYRCRECVREVEDKFFTGNSADYAIVFSVCAVMGALGSLLLSFVGFFLLLLFFAAIFLGGIIAEAARRAVQGRRARYTAEVGWAGVACGVLAYSLIFLGAINVFLLLIIGGGAGYIVYTRLK